MNVRYHTESQPPSDWETWTLNFHSLQLSLTKEARIYNGLNTISLTSGAGKTGQPLAKKNETRTLFNTIHKNKLKTD